MAVLNNDFITIDAISPAGFELYGPDTEGAPPITYHEIPSYTLLNPYAAMSAAGEGEGGRLSNVIGSSLIRGVA